MQRGTVVCFYYLFACWLMSEVKGVRVTISADTIYKKTVSFSIVGNSLLVLVLALKPNCLLSATKITPHEYCFFGNVKHVL